MLPIHTILFPTDFSPASQTAFVLACALARDYQARLVVLHVMEPPRANFGELGPVYPVPGEMRAELEAALGQLKPVGGPVSMERRVVEGAPVGTIVDVARQLPAELIVLGTHGRRGIGRVLMGSVAENVLRQAPCPVLAVRSPLPEALVQNDPRLAEAGV